MRSFGNLNSKQPAIWLTWLRDPFPAMIGKREDGKSYAWKWTMSPYKARAELCAFATEGRNTRALHVETEEKECDATRVVTTHGHTL